MSDVPGFKLLPNPVKVTIASIVAFFATISAVAVGLPVIEPWLPSHRQYVRDLNDETLAKINRAYSPTKIGMYGIQIGIAKSRQSSIRDRIISMEIEAPKSDTADELIKRRQQIAALKVELSETEDEIKNLRLQMDKN